MNEKSIASILTNSPATTIGVVLVAVHLLSALLGPFYIPYGPTELAGPSLLPPGSAGHLLGTDVIGRDYLTRLVIGGRTSIFVAMLGALSAVVVGGLD
jgi:peptide/nickel transport system permease protein